MNISSMLPESWKLTFENSFDVVMLLSADGTILYVNSRLENVLGYAPDAWIGLNLTDFMHHESAPRPLQTFLDALNAATKFELPLKFRHVNGSFRMLQCHSQVLTIDQDFSAILINAAGFPVAYETLIEEKRQLKQQLSRFATAVDQSTESIIIADRDGKIEYVNPAFEKITGYSLEEVVGRTPAVLKSGRQSVEFYSALWDTILKGKVWSGQLTNRRKNGSFFDEEATITPVRDEFNEIINFVAVKRDITQERALEAQLQQSQKMEAVGRLAGGVAHDFNNTLMAVGSYAEMMKLKLQKGHPLQKDLSKLLKSVEQGASLTQQLLAFSRKQVLEPCVLNLNQVLSEMDSMLQRLIGEDIDLSFSLCKSLSAVKADRTQLQQVIMNLVVNARDAMPGGGRIMIHTENAILDELYILDHPEVLAGPYVVLTVADTGSGMDRETQEKIFEPFFTTKEKGKGTGLGLSTVFGIVRQSGGHIFLYSEKGAGTSFKVYLPQFKAEASAPECADADEDKIGGTETILLVDDNDTVRTAVSEILTRYGYKVLQASNGLDALDVITFNGNNIDLLITDVIMPHMNGTELVRTLESRGIKVKVLYMSGYTDEAIQHHGIITTGSSFLQKPASIETILQKIHKILN